MERKVKKVKKRRSLHERGGRWTAKWVRWWMVEAEETRSWKRIIKVGGRQVGERQVDRRESMKNEVMIMTRGRIGIIWVSRRSQPWCYR